MEWKSQRYVMSQDFVNYRVTVMGFFLGHRFFKSQALRISLAHSTASHDTKCFCRSSLMKQHLQNLNSKPNIDEIYSKHQKKP